MERYKHNQYLAVPFSQKGIKNLSTVDGSREDIKFYEMPEDLYQEMEDKGVISVINVNCGTLIDSFETEKIPLKQCAKALEILKNAGYEKSQMALALKEAMNYGTFVECDF